MPDDSTRIIAAEKQLAAAHLTMDLALIDALLHPDYIVLQPDGQVETKAQVLASYATANERHWEFANADQFEVRISGGTAVVTGRWRARGTNRDVSFDYTAKFMSIWIQEEGRWRNLAYQATEVG